MSSDERTTRNVRLIRSPTGLVVFGTRCRQWCWVGPRITSRLPWVSSTAAVSAGRDRCFSWNVREAPKLTEPMTGSGPNTGSSSLCHATLSRPVR